MSKYKKTLSVVRLEQLPDLDINISQTNIFNLPTVQRFSPEAINKSTPMEFEEKSIYSFMKNLKVSDSAFINSMLSYATYNSNLWTLTSLDKNIGDMQEKFRESFSNSKELYNLKLWHFLKENFTKITDSHFMRSTGLYKSSYGFDVNYEYKDGQYSALNGLAHASVITRNNPNGEGKILHVSFRGTEFEKLPSYIQKAYLNMSAYYQNFLPLEKAILDYAKDPRNNITSIEISGHSLGGAMVQEFLKRNPKENIDTPIQGYTFGSPGAEKKNFMHFLNMGHQILKRRNIVLEDFVPHKLQKDNRLHEFYHTNDPVPKIGLLGYTRKGISYNLFDTVYENAKEAKIEKMSFLEKIPVFGKMINYFKEKYINAWKVRFHDSDRYVNNIKSIMELNYQTYPELIPQMKTVTNGWQQFLESDRKFRQLSIKYKSSFEQIIREDNPELDSNEIKEKLLKYRELMKYENETNLTLSQQGESKVYSQNFLGNFTSGASFNNNPQNTLKELRKKYTTTLEEKSTVLNPS